MESRYSQMEKKALSIIWGIEHFNLFLYGYPFTFVTDHKPLEIIYGSPSSKTSARIERWVLCLLPYQFKIRYKPEKENSADYLSRHPTDKPSEETELTEEYINFVTSSSVPKTMSLHEIARETNSDKEL